jgi:hypothetical protein
MRRLRAPEWIVAVSGAALLVSLFVPWYSTPGPTCLLATDAEGAYFAREGVTSAGCSGWESLAVLDVILALIALSAIALVVVTATQSVPAVPIALDAVVALAGIVATVLVLVRVLWIPDGADGREWGLWLALAAALGIAAGAWLAMRDERLPTAAQPEIEARPAPRPEGSA